MSLAASAFNGVAPVAGPDSNPPLLRPFKFPEFAGFIASIAGFGFSNRAARVMADQAR
jgi:hypothetical protein